MTKIEQLFWEKAKFFLSAWIPFCEQGMARVMEWLASWNGSRQLLIDGNPRTINLRHVMHIATTNFPTKIGLENF